MLIGQALRSWSVEVNGLQSLFKENMEVKRNDPNTFLALAITLKTDFLSLY